MRPAPSAGRARKADTAGESVSGGADGSACTGGRHGGCGRRYWEEMGLMDEIRRALLGDKEAARRLTDAWVKLWNFLN